MSQTAVEQLIGRLVTDDVFRERIRYDVSVACREHGFALTQNELMFVQRINLDAISQLAELVSDDLRRSSHF
jgi:hypothetical protein